VALRVDPRGAQTWGLALSFGWRIAAGVLVGYWLDGWLDTGPVFLTVFAVGALAGSIYEMLRASGSSPRSGTDDDRP
jgi:F0F1-type ATP synthase assembly protein I